MLPAFSLLVDEGEEDITVPGPFVAEQLDELITTLSSPLNHLKSANDVKGNTSNSESSKNVETEPGHDLTEVVGASDVLKKTAVRDNEIVGSLGTHVLETHVADEVKNHEAAEPWEANDDMPERKVFGSRDVDVVTNGKCKAPVVSTVLEKIEDGHGEGTEFMHKDGLKQTLGVVDHPEEECNLLVVGQGERSLLTIHGENTKGKKSIDNPWSSVFTKIHRTESNLWAQILENNLNQFLTFIDVLRELLQIVHHDRILLTRNSKILTAWLSLWQ